MRCAVARFVARAWLVITAAAPFACADPARSYGDPTIAPGAPEAAVIVESPVAWTEIAERRTVVAGRLAGDAADAVWVEVFSGDRARPVAAGAPASGRFSLSVPVLPGTNRIVVRASDAVGRAQAAAARFVGTGAAPGVLVDTPTPGLERAPGATVAVSGRIVAAAGRTPAGLRVEGAGAAVDAVLAGDAFSVGVRMPDAAAPVLTLTARDDQGAVTRWDIPLTRDAGAAPALVLTEPAEGAAVDAARVVVAGRVDGAFPPGTVVTASVNGAVPDLIGTTAAFTRSLAVDPGTNTIDVAVETPSGRTGRLRRTVYAPRTAVLPVFAADAPRTPWNLSLDRAQLESLMPEDVRKSIVLVRLDLTAVLKAALLRVREPERYGVDTSGWGPAERNMSRLLGMSPDTADLRGTSMAALLDLAPRLGLPPARVLARTFDRPVDAPFLGIDDVAGALESGLIATHPAATIDPATGRPVLPVTLDDALRDLAPLGERYGPAGAHPGILRGPVSGRVLLPGFRMNLAALSNYRRFAGVHLGRGGEDLYVAVPPPDSTGDPRLDVSFDDPSRFSITGTADEPTVNLRFALDEHRGFLRGSSDVTAGDVGGIARGDAPVWTVAAPWTIERVVWEASFNALREAFADTGFVRRTAFAVGAISEAAVVEWNRGLVTVRTAGDIGDPPPPTLAWDLLGETVQVRLHDGGTPEGEAGVQFELRNVPVGLSGAVLAERVRPALQAQRDAVVRAVLGDRPLVASGTDIIAVRETNGRTYLVCPSDADRAQPPMPGRVEGLYADAALAMRVSDAAVDGVFAGRQRLELGRALPDLFIADRSAAVYRVRVSEGAAGVTLRWLRVAGP